MRITDLKCAVIGDNPIVRIVADEGLSGFGAVESYKPYIKPHVLMYRDYILGADPTHVERVMLNIRHRGAFKPWGSAVSAIELALAPTKSGQFTDSIDRAPSQTCGMKSDSIVQIRLPKEPSRMASAARLPPPS